MVAVRVGASLPNSNDVIVMQLPAQEPAIIIVELIKKVIEVVEKYDCSTPRGRVSCGNIGKYLSLDTGDIRDFLCLIPKEIRTLVGRIVSAKNGGIPVPSDDSSRAVLEEYNSALDIITKISIARSMIGIWDHAKQMKELTDKAFKLNQALKFPIDGRVPIEFFPDEAKIDREIGSGWRYLGPPDIRDLTLLAEDLSSVN